METLLRNYSHMSAKILRSSLQDNIDSPIDMHEECTPTNTINVCTGQHCQKIVTTFDFMNTALELPSTPCVNHAKYSPIRRIVLF